MPKSMHVSGDIVVWLNLLTHIDTPTHSLILKAAQQAADVGADANADVEVCQPGRSIALKSTLQTHLVQGSERNSSTNSKIYTYLPGYFLFPRRKFHCIILLTTQTHTHTHTEIALYECWIIYASQFPGSGIWPELLTTCLWLCGNSHFDLACQVFTYPISPS